MQVTLVRTRLGLLSLSSHLNERNQSLIFHPCWLQVKFFNTSCNEHFFPPWGPGWVEYWSGGLQIYEQCRIRKVSIHGPGIDSMPWGRRLFDGASSGRMALCSEAHCMLLHSC
jgi:hypothetical protein